MPVKQALPTKSFPPLTGMYPFPKRAIAETSTKGFFTVDNSWTVKSWNKAAEKILKVPATEIIGKNIWQKFEGIIPRELFNVDQRVFLQDEPVHFYKYWEEMGAWFDVITYHDNDTLSVSFKSSKQPHAELTQNPVERLKALTEFYRYVTEITNDCLWEWNLISQEIFWIDEGHKRIFGYQVEDTLIAQSFWEQCIHPDDKERVLLELKNTFLKKSTTIWETTYRFKAANGTYLYVLDRGHIIYEKGRATRIIGTTQDINEKTLLEIKLANERLVEQKEITDAAFKAQENERNTIAVLLNENLNQVLAAIKWSIQLAKVNQDKRDECLDKSSEYLNHVIGELRKIYKRLAKPNIHFVGLFDSIKNMIIDTNKEQTVQFKFIQTGINEETDLDKHIQLDLLRIVQELMDNIIEHAQATLAKITICRKADNLVLTVSDNGIGDNNHSEKKGFGIINIKSRAALYGGTVLVNSKTGKGKGYTLQVVLPCLHKVFNTQ